MTIFLETHSCKCCSFLFFLTMSWGSSDHCLSSANYVTKLNCFTSNLINFWIPLNKFQKLVFIPLGIIMKLVDCTVNLVNKYLGCIFITSYIFYWIIEHCALLYSKGRESYVYIFWYWLLYIGCWYWLTLQYLLSAMTYLCSYCVSIYRLCTVLWHSQCPFVDVTSTGWVVLVT